MTNKLKPSRPNFCRGNTLAQPYEGKNFGLDSRININTRLLVNLRDHLFSEKLPTSPSPPPQPFILPPMRTRR
jgi:hypothetical protein